MAEAAGTCVAEAGCNLLTDIGSGATGLAAKAFCLTPHHVGSSIGILEITESARAGSGSIKRSRYRPTVGDPNLWIDFRLSTHTRDHDLHASSSDVVIALE